MGAGSGMQFDKVETVGAAAPPVCAQCHLVLDEYFELGGRLFCRACVDAYRGGRGAGSFGRALLFGAGAAVLGTVIWLAVISILNSELGIIAIGVGLLVGVAVRKGARGLGGWKYQALAMVLTYFSITASYIPFVLKGMVEAGEKQAKEQHATTAGNGDQAAAQPDPAPRSETANKAQTKPSAGMVAFAFLLVFAFALATPFLGGASNFMGLLIIGIALYEAWKINRRVPLSGPFRFRGALSVPAPAPVTAPPAPT